MNSLVRLTSLSTSSAGRRILAVSSRFSSSTLTSTQNDALKLKNFDPNNYDIEPRIPTMNDTMEPYGSWKVAYEAEKRAGNRSLAMGIACFTVALGIFLTSPATDGILMPNLDNIMEETTPMCEDEDMTGRVSV